MLTPPPPLQTGDLNEALAQIGRDDAIRKALLDLLRRFEASNQDPTRLVRDEVTGPMADALHRDVGTVSKRLRNGLQISCRYTSRIVRDFVLADDEPEYVWEPQTTRALLHLGQRARHIVIGGAYMGDQAIPLAHSIRDAGGTCHCFELSLDNAAMLRKNAEDNGLTNIVINTVGLWSKDGCTLKLVGDDSHASPAEVGQAGPDTFEAVTIEAYLRRKNIASLDLIMLDIEGGELDALRGAAAFLARPAGEAPNVIFEVHRSYVDWSNGLRDTDIVRLLEGNGYSVFAIRDYQGNVEMGNRPIELVELDGIYLDGPPHGFNMIAVKDTSVLDPSVYVVCRGVSPKLLKHRDPKYHAPLT